jgi:hypothetical protein
MIIECIKINDNNYRGGENLKNTLKMTGLLFPFIIIIKKILSRYSSRLMLTRMNRLLLLFLLFLFFAQTTNQTNNRS